MKKILILAGLVTLSFADIGSDIYDIDNKAWVQDKQKQYSIKAEGDKEKIKCIKSQNEERNMRKCLK